MTDFDNTNRGVLFKNDRKQDGDKKPEYTGSLNVDGVEFFLDAWLKTSKTGSKFMSVSVKRKDKQPEAAQSPERTRPAAKPVPAGGGFDDFDSDVPF
ncbi:MAG: hypothetical protein HQ445_05465 [Polaromonas sp.]|nr:hypothetical protein [Polaromonas sp.]